MALIRFDVEEFNKFLGTIEWLRDCKIIWNGRAPLAMAETSGPPGEETVKEIQYQKGEEIEPIRIATAFYAYLKGGYHSETGDGTKSNAKAIAERELRRQRARDQAEKLTPRGEA